jgi:hypothetical protein
MMSATDLITFARMHINNGVADNGARILSEQSAKLMRTKTGTYGGPQKITFGLGWALLEPGFVRHSGGGPGILSSLHVHPASGAALAILTNSAEGSSVVDALTREFMLSRGSEPTGVAAQPAPQNKGVPSANTRFDPKPFVGTYEGVSTVFIVEQENGQLVLRVRERSAYYETMTTDEHSASLRAVSDGVFVVGPGISGYSNQQVGFITPDAEGRMQHFAPGGSLFKRTS